ncbi:hypothetical protein ACTJKO_08560 [Curtobacterium sp. 22159]|uniref:hypothetical protein n=1 Tax=Curtobacterium sp. 22159 TaxID=3453882 RepID=UPI003F86BF48
MGAVLVLAGALTLTGATSASASGFCIPILMDCSQPSSSPTPSATPTATPTPNASAPSGTDATTPSSPGVGTGSGPDPTPGDGGTTDGQEPTSGTTAAPDPAWGPATADDTTVFTQPSAQLSSSSIEIGGLSGLALVRVPLADGSEITVIRLSADRVAMDDFTLDVRGESNGTSAVTRDSRMELRGHVEVYLDSVTAELPGGKHLTLGADTPPPGSELPSTWARVDLGLVGATADGITHTGSDLRIRPGAG